MFDGASRGVVGYYGTTEPAGPIRTLSFQTRDEQTEGTTYSRNVSVDLGQSNGSTSRCFGVLRDRVGLIVVDVQGAAVALVASRVLARVGVAVVLGGFGVDVDLGSRGVDVVRAAARTR